MVQTGSMVGVMKKALISAVLFALSVESHAGAPSLRPYESYTINCVLRAANEYQVPGNVLLAIGSVEGGKEGTASRNDNGTYDLGVFQINTAHWRSGGIMSQAGISQLDIRDNGCYSARVAAWLIRSRVDESKGKKSYWTAVADYHSKTPKYNAKYRKKLVSYSVSWGKWMEKNTNAQKIVMY